MAFQPSINHSLDRWEDVPRLNMGSRIRMVNFNFFESLARHSQKYLAVLAKPNMPVSELRPLITHTRQYPRLCIADGAPMFLAGVYPAVSFSIDLDVQGWLSSDEPYLCAGWQRMVITTPNFDSGHLFITYDALLSMARYLELCPQPKQQVLAVQAARNAALAYMPCDMSEVAGVYLGNFQGRNGIYQVAANLGKLMDAISLVICGEPYRGSKRNIWVYALMVRLAFVQNERSDLPLPWFEQAERIYSRRLTKWQRITLDDELRLGASLRLACMLSPWRYYCAA